MYQIVFLVNPNILMERIATIIELFQQLKHPMQEQKPQG